MTISFGASSVGGAFGVTVGLGAWSEPLFVDAGAEPGTIVEKANGVLAGSAVG